VSTDTLFLTASVDIQAAAKDKPPRVAILAYAGGAMTVSGWGPVVVDLAGLDITGAVPLLSDHNSDLAGIVGHGAATVVNHQLHVNGTITSTTEASKQIVELGKSGFPFQASVGVQPTERRSVSAGEKVNVNGKTITATGDGFTLVRSGKLREVSIVAIGADSATSVTIAAKGKTMNENTNTVNASTPDEMRFAWDRAGLTDAERIEARLDAFRRDYGDVLPDFGRGMVRAASTGSMTWGDAEREILRGEVRALQLQQIRANRPQGPAIHASQRDTQPLVIEAALSKTLNLASREKCYQPEVLEASDRLGSIGLQEVLLLAAERGGYAGGRRRVDTSNLRDVLRAAFTTHSIVDTLSNVANKSLQDGFNSIEQSWREISGRRNAPNFKQMKVLRMTASLEYEEVGAGGEIKHGTLGEESYSMQAKTYARMAVLRREDIINDDLGALSDLRNRLGVGAGRALNRAFWSTFLNDAAFFASSHNNLLSTTLTNAPESVSEAVAQFAALTDADGHPLGIQPAILLTGPTLAPTAKRLFVSSEIRNTASNTEYGIANTVQGMYRPVTSAYLESAAIPGASPTAWWLLADPRVLPVIEVCFLDGKESPTIESTDADFDTLGIQFRGYHDFGIALAEYRGGVKSSGSGS
jgi:hypothetical protein